MGSFPHLWACLVAQMVKNLPSYTGDPGSIPGIGRSHGEESGYLFHGQRSLVGYSSRGHKESDTTEQLTLSLFPHLTTNSFGLLA